MQVKWESYVEDSGRVWEAGEIKGVSERVGAELKSSKGAQTEFRGRKSGRFKLLLMYILYKPEKTHFIGYTGQQPKF